MHGTPTIHFSELFADTIRAHGVAWSEAYYRKHGMASWEFGFWLHVVCR